MGKESSRQNRFTSRRYPGIVIQNSLPNTPSTSSSTPNKDFKLPKYVSIKRNNSNQNKPLLTYKVKENDLIYRMDNNSLTGNGILVYRNQDYQTISKLSGKFKNGDLTEGVFKYTSGKTLEVKNKGSFVDNKMDRVKMIVETQLKSAWKEPIHYVVNGENLDVDYKLLPSEYKRDINTKLGFIPALGYHHNGHNALTTKRTNFLLDDLNNSINQNISNFKIKNIVIDDTKHDIYEKIQHNGIYYLAFPDHNAILIKNNSEVVTVGLYDEYAECIKKSIPKFTDVHLNTQNFQEGYCVTIAQSTLIGFIYLLKNNNYNMTKAINQFKTINGMSAKEMLEIAKKASINLKVARKNNVVELSPDSVKYQTYNSYQAGVLGWIDYSKPMPVLPKDAKSFKEVINKYDLNTQHFSSIAKTNIKYKITTKSQLESNRKQDLIKKLNLDIPKLNLKSNKGLSHVL